jgi:microcystin-dependent protein
MIIMKKILITLLLFLPVIGSADGVPTSFTYQGKALNAAGTAPLTSTVSFTLSITDPSSACILYQESQTNINLSTTNGIFALQVGSSIGATKRVSGVDPGLSMTTVFANAGTQLVSSNGSCPGYTPAANDVRKLHVVITPSSGSAITVSPDLTINAVPNSLVAETLQGQTPAQLNPAGVIVAFAGATCPSGYLLATGQSVLKTTYPALFSAISTIYGSTLTNFTLPDYRGIFLRGAGTNSQLTATSASLGTYQPDQMQGHRHTASDSYNFGSGALYDYTVANSQGNGYRDLGMVGPPTSDGTNGTPRTGLETRPSNTAVNYCIKY